MNLELKKLFQLTNQIAELEPWQWLYDIDLFAIQPEDYLEPFFVSIMGHEESCFGISVYYGLEGYEDFDTLSLENTGLPVSYLMSDISCMTCYFGPKEELEDEALWLFDDLGIEPNCDDQYFYFLSFEPRFYPYNLKDEQIMALVDVFEGLYYCLNEWINEHTIDPEWEKGEIIFADQIEGEWELDCIQRPNLSRSYSDFIVDDEYVEHLKRCGHSEETLCMELKFLNQPVRSENEEITRPINPLIFFVFDEYDKTFVDTQFLDLKDDEVEFVLDWITEYIEENGIMSCIHCHNPYILAAITDLCKKLDIEIIYDDLDELNVFLESISE